jgi:pimeloyl-[acyl-carrier protein] methyl ester esterase
MVALVILPGMDGTAQPRAEFVAALRPGIEPCVMSYPTDRTGYGELEALARAALPQDRPYVLLGESFSGPIAISIAASSPPQLIGLVLCATFACNPRPALGTLRWLLPLIPFGLAPIRLTGTFLLGRFASAPLLEAMRSTLAEVPTATLKARIGAVPGIDVRTALAKIRVPVLYLRATEDRLVPRRCADAIAAAAAQTRIVDVEAPHFLLQAAPAKAAAAVRAFIETLPQAAARAAIPS